MLFRSQEGSKLMWRREGKPAEVFAERGGFASVAMASPAEPGVVVWEGSANGGKTIFARRME